MSRLTWSGRPILTTSVQKLANGCTHYGLWDAVEFHQKIFDQCSYFMRPILEYACPVWHSSLTCKLKEQVEDIQRRALRVIHPQSSYKEALVELNLPTLYDRRELLCQTFYRNALHSNSRLYSLLPESSMNKHSYDLRNPRTLPLYKCRTNRFQNSFLPYCVRKWDRISWNYIILRFYTHIDIYFIVYLEPWVFQFLIIVIGDCHSSFLE